MSVEGQISAERTPPEEVAERPKRQRPKMSLEEQAAFLSAILRRCEMSGPELRGTYAGEALLTLTTDDMLRLETIQQTLAVFELHGADQMVKDKIARRFRK